MSYRPANYLPSLYKRTGVVSVVNSSYTSSGAVVRRETRYFDPNMILYLSVSSANNGGIFYTSEDVLPSATVVSSASTLVNASNITDHNDSTGAYDSGTSYSAGNEYTEIVYNLGKTYSSGLIYLNGWSCGSAYLRVYVSPDNSTWTKVIDIGSGSSQSDIAVGLFSSNTQYIKFTWYVSSGSATSSSGTWVLNSLEVYPLPAPRTSIQGDGTNKFYTALAYNTGYELIEVWNI